MFIALNPRPDGLNCLVRRGWARPTAIGLRVGADFAARTMHGILESARWALPMLSRLWWRRRFRRFRRLLLSQWLHLVNLLRFGRSPGGHAAASAHWGIGVAPEGRGRSVVDAVDAVAAVAALDILMRRKLRSLGLTAHFAQIHCGRVLERTQRTDPARGQSLRHRLLLRWLLHLGPVLLSEGHWVHLVRGIAHGVVAEHVALRRILLLRILLLRVLVLRVLALLMAGRTPS